MPQRPKSVTVISWLLIVLSVIGFFVIFGTAIATEFNHKFIPIILAYIAACLVQVVMGIGMLNGKNWARLFFLWLTPISFVIGFIGGRINPGSLLMIVWYIVVAICLTRPAAHAYFSESREWSPVKQWALFLCGRYLSRKRIVLLSITAVMLCCAMLITVASLFTGFIHAVESSASDYLGDIVLSTPMGHRMEGFGPLLEHLQEVPGVESATPVLEGKGLLLTGPGQVRPAQVLGIDLQSRLRVSPLKEALVRQKDISSELISFTPAQLPSETVGGFVGIGLIASPDEITDAYDMQLVSSFFDQKAVLTTGALVENEPSGDSEQRYIRKVLRFTVTDVVQTGVYEFDQGFVYVPIEALSALLYPGKKPCADAIQIRLAKGTDEDAAIAMVRGAWMDFAKERFDWASGAVVESSRKMQARLIGEYRKQLNMLMLIFGIVSFGVVLLVFCIFYLIVMTRQKDIAVVKSCGASNSSVAAMYLLFGVVNGAAGALMGAVLGWVVTRNIETAEKAITAMTGLKVWKASTYLFSRIPNEVNWTWAVWICLAALAAAVVGALIPAIAAARVRPVKLLRYE